MPEDVKEESEWAGVARMGLDPLLMVHARLFIGDILSLKCHPFIPDIFFYKCHPLTKVHIMGTVVGVHVKEKFSSVAVDDGSGVLVCTVWEDSDFKSSVHEDLLGSLVSILGKISTYREEFQLSVSSIDMKKDPNEELLHWLEIADRKQCFYDLPYDVKKGTSAFEQTLINDSDRSMALLAYLKKQSTSSFAFSEIVARENLAQILSCSVEQCTALAKKAFRSLIANGYLKNIDRGKDIFELVSVEHVAENLLELIQTLLEKEHYAVKGVPLGSIVKECAARNETKGVSKNFIIASVNHLIDMNVIYESDPKMYRVLKQYQI
eukprot:Nk52_evm18s1129 gene=Nk52_evmTU18s1129